MNCFPISLSSTTSHALEFDLELLNFSDAESISSLNQVSNVYFDKFSSEHDERAGCSPNAHAATIGSSDELASFDTNFQSKISDGW